MREKRRTHMVVMIALLIAMDVVLTRLLSINMDIVRIGFGFVPVAVCAMMYGPAWAAVSAAIGDVIGITLVMMGTPFPGITLSAALTGVVFGLFLHRRSKLHKKNGQKMPIFFAVAINCFVISLLLTTYWLSILRGVPYWTLLPTRFLQSCIMFAVQMATLVLIEKKLGNRIRAMGNHHA